LQKNVDADHIVVWQNPAGVTVAAGDKARVDFPAAFVTEAANWATADFTLTDGGGAVAIDSVNTDAEPASCSGDKFSVRVNSATDEFEIRFCSAGGGYVAFGAADTFTFTIDGTDPDGNLTNPVAAANDLVVALVGDDKGDGFGANDDVGSLALSIIDSDQVQVTATVDPTFTFTLTGTNCALGSLSSTTLDACIVVSTVSTNANGGYTATLLDDDILGLRTVGGDSISDTGAGSTIVHNGGTEQFGISTEGAGVDIAQYTTNGGEIDPADCGLDKVADIGLFDPITTTAQSYATSGGPIANDEVELCIAAHSTVASEAGSYSDTLTLIATGTF
jgi:hypothetical protein